MSVLDRIAYFQGGRDEAPNQELARALVESRDRTGIEEIARNLVHENPNVQSDCLKVLYEIGYLAPELISDYVNDFLGLLRSKNNRLVWGAMIALSTIAGIVGAELFPHCAEIEHAMEEGSVITRDAGLQTLALVAAGDAARRQALLPYLLQHLRTCRPKDVPQHAEKIAVAVDAANRAEFVAVLQERMPDLTSSEAARIRKVIKALG